jgi:hypothetical protein
LFLLLFYVLNWRKLSENVQLQLLLDITASTRNLKLDHDPTHSRRSRGQAKTCAYSYLNERSSANFLQETNTKNCSHSRIKCSIVSPSFSQSRHNVFSSFLYIFILLLWRMYAPVNNFNLIGSLWRSPLDLQLIFNIGCSFPFFQICTAQVLKTLIVWYGLCNNTFSKPTG